MEAALTHNLQSQSKAWQFKVLAWAFKRVPRHVRSAIWRRIKQALQAASHLVKYGAVPRLLRPTVPAQVASHVGMPFIVTH